jgi:hypothetical protein
VHIFSSASLQSSPQMPCVKTLVFMLMPTCRAVAVCNPWPVPVGFVVGEVALGQVFL